MCLAIPGIIKDKKENKATVDFMGLQKEVDMTLLPQADVGQYVIVHAGFAIQTLTEDDAKERIGLWSEMSLRGA
jgi:hydrogenase expression/formation protein HypC